MLQRLLERVAQGGLVSLADLARELEVSPALVELMVADLARAGYLRLAGGCAEAPCQSCRTARLCTRDEVKVWMVSG